MCSLSLLEMRRKVRVCQNLGDAKKGKGVPKPRENEEEGRNGSQYSSREPEQCSDVKST